jgi:Gpi18-like mannosyltransferase
MELVLILGLVLTATGIIVGLYLPFFVSRYPSIERIWLFVIVAAALVMIGMTCEIFAVWPIQEIEIDQQQPNAAVAYAYSVNPPNGY